MVGTFPVRTPTSVRDSHRLRGTCRVLSMPSRTALAVSQAALDPPRVISDHLSGRCDRRHNSDSNRDAVAHIHRKGEEGRSLPSGCDPSHDSVSFLTTNAHIPMKG